MTHWPLEYVQCRRNTTHNSRALVHSVLRDSVSQFSDLRERKKHHRAENIVVRTTSSDQTSERIMHPVRKACRVAGEPPTGRFRFHAFYVQQVKIQSAVHCCVSHLVFWLIAFCLSSNTGWQTDNYPGSMFQACKEPHVLLHRNVSLWLCVCWGYGRDCTRKVRLTCK